MRVPVTFERGALDLVVGVAGEWVVGINLTPSADPEAPAAEWVAPAYVDPAVFDEQNVTVDAMDLPVPGTLSMPRRHGPVPAVLLLAGSGPHDRDETIGVNKPLKDLAWGLASRGIAVLRTEKVTYAHGRELPETLTLADEYVPHARAALDLLRTSADIDPQRLVVGGHSLGGTVAPRVAAVDGGVAGLVMLAAGAQPMHRAAVRQFRYLAGLGSEQSAGLAATAEAMAALADRVDRPDLTADTPPAELPFGVPGSYWLDVRGYDPVATAAALTVPMLFIQGGRDYQVTVADDLALWRAGLAGRGDVTFTVFEPGNHLLAAGQGPPSPAEYAALQHVDVSLVDEISAWVGRLG
jgi:dienelactone hydrolase